MAPIEDRGVSALFLREFTREILQKIERGEALRPDRNGIMTAYRLDQDNLATRERVGRGIWTKEVVECFIKPATKDLPQENGGGLGIRYVDLIERRKSSDAAALRVGRASVFVSHAWGGPGRAGGSWLKLVEVVTEHSNEIEARGEPPPYYWIDIFAINQFWGTADATDDMPDWAHMSADKGFQRVIDCTQSTLLFLDPWNKPECCERAWCLFEILHTLQARPGTLQTTMALEGRHEMVKATQEGAMRAWFDAVGNINLEKADAWSVEDKGNIFDLVRQGSGFGNINETISDAMRTSVAHFGVRMLNVSPSQRDAFVAITPSSAFEQVASIIDKLSWERCPSLPFFLLVPLFSFASLLMFLDCLCNYYSDCSTGSISREILDWPSKNRILFPALYIGLLFLSFWLSARQSKHSLEQGALRPSCTTRLGRFLNSERIQPTVCFLCGCFIALLFANSVIWGRISASLSLLTGISLVMVLVLYAVDTYMRRLQANVSFTLFVAEALVGQGESQTAIATLRDLELSCAAVFDVASRGMRTVSLALATSLLRAGNSEEESRECFDILSRLFFSEKKMNIKSSFASRMPLFFATVFRRDIEMLHLGILPETDEVPGFRKVILFSMLNFVVVGAASHFLGVRPDEQRFIPLTVIAVLQFGLALPFLLRLVALHNESCEHGDMAAALYTVLSIIRSSHSHVVPPRRSMEIASRVQSIFLAAYGPPEIKPIHHKQITRARFAYAACAGLGVACGNTGEAGRLLCLPTGSAEDAMFTSDQSWKDQAAELLDSNDGNEYAAMWTFVLVEISIYWKFIGDVRAEELFSMAVSARKKLLGAHHPLSGIKMPECDQELFDLSPSRGGVGV